MKIVFHPFTFVLVSLILVFSACNKDQEFVKDLSGTWQLTGVTKNGQIADFEPQTFYFENCKIHKKGVCTGAHTLVKSASDNTITAFDFIVLDDANRIKIDFNPESALTDIDAEIKEFIENSLRLEFQRNGDAVQYILSKQ